MRLYLPALSSELLGDAPPHRDGWTALPGPGVGGEELEVLEDDAQTEAALASLVLLRESLDDEGGQEALRRLILAVDTDLPGAAPVGTGVIAVQAGAVSWADVRALLVDGADAEPLVKAVLDANEQDEADDAVAALWDEALEWYDPGERLDLATILRP